MHATQQPGFPLTVYYAFKQAESEEGADDGEGDSDDAGTASTGWETMLAGLIETGFSITGTWPMRTEASNKPMAFGMNALATSIVIVCRPRPAAAPKSDRAKFTAELKRELPAALKNLQHGNIAPVDLAQASIGPGMAIFSKYDVVREANGRPMTVRTALQLINKALDEVLAEQEGEYDADTRWAVAWFEQFGVDDGPYGVAETLSKAKNCGLDKLQHAGVLTKGGGKVKLVPRQAMPTDAPPNPQEMTVWEVTQRLIRALMDGGETDAARLLARVGHLGDVARDLAYRLYTTCERKRWAQEALAYNSLVIAWPQLVRLAASGGGQASGGQPTLPGL